MRAFLLVPCLLTVLALSPARQASDDAAGLGGVWEGTEAIDRGDEPEWTGRLIGDRTEFELPVTGYCGGTATPNNYTIKLEGPLSITSKGQRQLRLTGDVRPCPSMGCTFRHTLTLTWKRAKP